ncbi:MAG TPA: hypothetical protein PKY30_18475, partial [Myxococcota bacterium]|nr:hypothetical protein [Myxococcota bacterium]
EERLSEVGLPPDLHDMAVAAGRSQRATTALAYLQREVGEEAAEELQSWAAARANALGVPGKLLVWPPKLPNL